MNFSKNTISYFELNTFDDVRNYKALFCSTSEFTVYGYRPQYLISTRNGIATFNLYCGIVRHGVMNININQFSNLGVNIVYQPKYGYPRDKIYACSFFRCHVVKPCGDFLYNYEFAMTCRTYDYNDRNVILYSIPYESMLILINSMAERIYNSDLIPGHSIVPERAKHPMYIGIVDQRINVPTLTLRQQNNIKYILYNIYCMYRRLRQLYNIQSHWFNSLSNHVSRNIVGILVTQPNLYTLLRSIPGIIGSLCDYIIQYLNLPRTTTTRRILFIIIILIIAIIIATCMIIIISLM